MFLSFLPPTPMRPDEPEARAVFVRQREPGIRQWMQGNCGPAAHGAGEPITSDPRKTWRWIARRFHQNEGKVIRDGNSVTERPTWLPIGRHRAGQGDVGADPVRLAASALLRRDADDPADRCRFQGFFFTARCFRDRFLLGATTLDFRLRRRGATTAARATLLRTAATANLLAASACRAGIWQRKSNSARKVR